MGTGLKRKGLLISLLAVLLIANVWAELEQPSLQLEADGPVVQGKDFKLIATLLDSEGNPLKAKQILFFSEAAFREYELARKSTYSEGIAVIEHSLPYPGTFQLRAVFPGDDSLNEVSASVDISVQVDSENPLEEFEDEGVSTIIEIIVVILMGVIWSIYASILYRMYLIRKEGKG